MNNFTQPVVCFGCSAINNSLADKPLLEWQQDHTERALSLLVEEKNGDMVPFCHPSCVLAAIEHGKLELQSFDLDEYFHYVHKARESITCVTCGDSPRTPTWVIASAPMEFEWWDSPICEWDEPGMYVPGGAFCSARCFHKGMLNEVRHFNVCNLGRWYEHIPFGVESDEASHHFIRPHALERSTNKSRKYGRKEERLPAQRLIMQL